VAVGTVLTIHLSEGDGDILLFLTGQVCKVKVRVRVRVRVMMLRGILESVLSLGQEEGKQQRKKKSSLI